MICDGEVLCAKADVSAIARAVKLRNGEQTHSGAVQPGWHCPLEYLRLIFRRTFRCTAKRCTFSTMSLIGDELPTIERTCRLPARCPCNQFAGTLFVRTPCSSQLTSQTSISAGCPDIEPACRPAKGMGLS
jgi:hypothetical protein